MRPVASCARAIDTLRQSQQPKHRARSSQVRRRSARAMRHQLVVQDRTQLIEHQAFDYAEHALTLRFTLEDEADAHARLLIAGSLLGRDHPLHFAGQHYGIGERRDAELEDEVRSDWKRPFRANERTAAANVLRVIGEERVKSLVLDL